MFILRIETKNERANSILFSPGLTPSAGIDMIKSKYRQLAKKFRPDTFTGSREVSQRVICDLNEAMRILSKAHAQPFAEPKPVE